MITPELVARINELARKKRSEGLSEAETAEQASLRRVYLDSIRARGLLWHGIRYEVGRGGAVLRMERA